MEGTHTGLSSNSGKSSQGPRSAGEKIAKYFETLFTTIIGISSLGTSITFGTIVTDIRDVPYPPLQFSKQTVQWFLAVSWLLFVASIGATVFLASLLNFYRASAVRDYDDGREESRRVRWWMFWTSSVLFLLVVGAFVFLSLTIVAYQVQVGWCATSLTGIFGILGFGAAVHQCPWCDGLSKRRKMERGG